MAKIKKTLLEIQQEKRIKRFKKSLKPKIKVKKKIKHKTKKEYYKELKSKKWYLRREQILKLDNYKCRHCGTDKNLQVHHTKYIGIRKPWQYPNELLITLCKECHEKEHYLYIFKG